MKISVAQTRPIKGDIAAHKNSKQYLHPGQKKVFVNGHNQLFIKINKHIIAPAICYELSIESHSEFAIKNGTDIYVASVCDSVNGVDKDLHILSQIAKKHGINVLMSNFTGESGGYECAGKSAIWNTKGKLTGQLADKTEGVLIYDTETKNVIKIEK
jgi:predicted amidohydrolase